MSATGGWRATPPAAEEYVRAAGPRLLRFARSLTLHEADAEDLVQDCLVKVVVHWRQVAAADDADRYVRRLMVNTFLSSRRPARSRTVPAQDVGARLEPVPAPDDAVHARLVLDALLATLDPRSRAVLLLRHVEDLPDAEVAAAVGTSVGNVRVIAHRAMVRLRPLLVEDTADRR